MYARNNIFIKRILNMRICHLYFTLNFIFWGNALGHFSQCFFLIFCRQPTMVADIVFQLPPPLPPQKKKKKASYGPARPVCIFKKMHTKIIFFLWKDLVIFLVFNEEIAFKHFLFMILQSSDSFYFSVITQTLKSENWKSFKDYDFRLLN